MKLILEGYSDKTWFVKANTLLREQFINLMRNAFALVGNSSMGIVEAPHGDGTAPQITENSRIGLLGERNIFYVLPTHSEIFRFFERKAKCILVSHASENYQTRKMRLIPYFIMNY